MAEIRQWANAALESVDRANAAYVHGGKSLCLISQVEVASGDDDGSIYKLARLPANAIPIKCEIFNDAISSGSDYDLGLYEEDGTIAVDKEVFAATLDMNSGAAIGSPKNGLQTGPSIDEMGDKVWELAGKTLKNKQEGFVLALTANTVGSAAGTISVYFYCIPV